MEHLLEQARQLVVHRLHCRSARGIPDGPRVLSELFLEAALPELRVLFCAGLDELRDTLRRGTVVNLKQRGLMKLC